MTGRHRLRRALGGLLAGWMVLAASGLPAGAPVAAAPGDAWQNEDGTATTVTGQASTDRPARVFAFELGVTIVSCSSPQGRCVVGIPDGPTSFEIFVTDPTTTVTFTIETDPPMACGGTITFKASFDGRTYVAQPTLPNGNDCAPRETCPVTDVTGWFEPVQAVFQDDPLDAANHVPDAPGKRLLRTSPTSLVAELPMVLGKPTLLYGIDHTQADAPKDRDRIVIRGTTTGTTPVPVAMHFSGTKGVTLLHTTPIMGEIPLDGPCGPPAPFEVSVDASDGIWPRTFPPFIFAAAGPYTITNELTRENGEGTGITVSVSGTVVATTMPTIAFVPMVLDPFAPPKGLSEAAARLRKDSMTFIPDLYPVEPGSLRGVLGLLIDARSRVRAERSSWGTWVQEVAGLTDDNQVLRDVTLAALADWATTAAILGDIDRTVVVLSDHDIELLNRGNTEAWDGLALTGKTVLVQHSKAWPLVAHEVAHTLAYVWTGEQMQAQCGLDYHNLPAGLRLAHGVAITEGGNESRRRVRGESSIMSFGRGAKIWIDQCTYANLVRVLQAPQDPAVILVRGRLARNGTSVGGELLPSYQLDGIADLEAGSGGEWAVVASDAGGTVLGRFPFEPGWSVPDLGEELDVVSFGHRIPAIPGLARIALEGPGGRLDELVLSAHAPALTIASPGDEGVARPKDGKVRVRWTATDQDGDRLLSTVLVSTDGGRTYQAQSVEQDGDAYQVTVAPGSAQHVKVVVTDGGRSAEAVTAFSTETPEDLVARLAAAYRRGSGEDLFDRLDPAVLERYGERQCRTFIASVRLPGLRWRVTDRRGPSPWAWETDGRTTEIPAAYTLTVDQRYRGTRSRIPIHVAIRDGRLSWFADCGRPR